MGTVYGPTEQWPRHSRAWFREALSVARAANWTAERFSDHSWGRVYCPAPDQSERCSFLVFSTGRGGEDAAKELVAAVRACPHRPVGDQGVIGEARNRIAAAERLVGAAETLASSDLAMIRVAELIELATRELDETDVILEDAIRLEDEARTTRAGVEADLRSRDLVSDNDVQPAMLAERAAEEAGVARRVLGNREEREARVLRGKAEAVRRRARALLGSLGAR